MQEKQNSNTPDEFSKEPNSLAKKAWAFLKKTLGFAERATEEQTTQTPEVSQTQAKTRIASKPVDIQESINRIESNPDLLYDALSEAEKMVSAGASIPGLTSLRKTSKQKSSLSK
jgi:hypothetical protein